MKMTYLYLIIMALTTYLIRVIPLTVFRSRIENTFVRSFLYYVPYVTLTVMTFPAIIHAAGSPYIGAAALAGGIIAAWLGVSLFGVSLTCCGIVLILTMVLPNLLL